MNLEMVALNYGKFSTIIQTVSRQRFSSSKKLVLNDERLFRNCLKTIWGEYSGAKLETKTGKMVGIE
jgi:hypothetical protein